MAAKLKQVPTQKGEAGLPLVLKLRSFGKLSAASEALILGLNGVETYAAGQAIRAASVASRPVAVADGWAAYYRLLADGRRQIISLLMPGDAIGFFRGADPHPELSLIALTRLELVNAMPLRVALNESRDGAFTDLEDCLHGAASLSQAQLVDHVVRLGRQSAFERMAHLLTETHHRLKVVDKAIDDRFLMPLTQEVLADILGLSVVHVNRTLQHLKSQKLIQLGAGAVRILNPELMAIVSDYRDPNANDR